MLQNKDEIGEFNIELVSNDSAVWVAYPEANRTVVLSINKDDPDPEWIVSLPRLNQFIKECELEFTDGPVICYRDLTKVGRLLHDKISEVLTTKDEEVDSANQ